MANPVIQIKRSAVAGKIPTTSNLQLGELAVNTYDGKVYLKQDQGGVGVGTTVIAINPWTVGLGSNTYNTYFTAGNVGIGSTIPTATLSVVGNANISGVATISTLSATTSTVTTENVTNLSVSGIGTIGIFQVSSGIVTATSGILTYYGDGSKLVNVSISTAAPSAPSAGNLWYNSNYGRLFLYYNDGDSSQWVDAAPFNVGFITSLTNVAFSSGTAASPSIYFTSDPSTGFFSPALGQITFVSAGSTILNINRGGIVVTGVTTSTDFNSTSDIKLKNNIKQIDDPLSKVLQIRGVSFTWKYSDETSAGVIAQDIEKVLPEIVKQNSDGYKSLNYNGLIGLLIEAMKEQQKQIDELREKINNK